MDILPSSQIDLHTRQKMILDHIRVNGKMRVADFSSKTGVSEVTIRKDLIRLEREGALSRVHGGAVSVDSGYIDHNYAERYRLNREAKIKIAKAVSNLVNNGDSILMNVGTTSEYVVEELRSKENLIIITNAFPIIARLNNVPNITSFFLGGCVEKSMQITIGDNVIEQLSLYTADKLIMGMDAVDPSLGLMSRNHVEDYIMHKMIAQSKEHILVVDDSKLGRSSFIRIANIDVFDTLVTNYCPEKKEILAQIEKKGIRVIVAE